MGNPNYDDYEKERRNLRECSKRNQIEGQQPHQRKVNRRSGEVLITQKGSDKGYLGNINKKDNDNSKGTMFECLKPGWKQQNTDESIARKENDEDEMIEEEEGKQQEKQEKQNECKSSYERVQFECMEEMKGVDVQKKQI